MATTEQQERLDQQAQQEGRQSTDDFISQFDANSLGYVPGQDNAAMWYAQAYFDQAEQTLHTARRVSEIAALQGIKRQIEDNVTARVLNRVQQQLRQNNQNNLQRTNR